MRTFDILMYVVLLSLVIYVAWMERQDWECPTLHSPLEECDGNGMPHRNSKPQPNDTCYELTQRIRRAAGAERRSIKWRKSLVLAAVIMFFLWILLLTPGGLPRWTQFYLSVIIGFTIIRAHFAWYSFHRFKAPEEHIYMAVDRLRTCSE